MTPNLFRIATKELAQDAALTWLLQWANPTHAQSNHNLHQCAQALTRTILGVDTTFPIQSVETWRQWEHIDILAEINGKIALVIEDKTFSLEHSNQLDSYRAAAEKEYLPRNFQLVFAYVKTGNESLASLRVIREKGWRTVNRQDLLAALKTYPTNNAVVDDFTAYLQEMEDQTNSYVQLDNLRTNEASVQGFFLQLQKEIGNDTDWGYVSNARGGFWAFYYGSQPHMSFDEVYVQFENNLSDYLQVVIRVAGWEEKISVLYDELAVLQAIGQKHGLELEKPKRFRAGGTSALAIVPDVFRATEQGKLDWPHLMDTLGRLEHTLAEFCQSHATAEKTKSMNPSNQKIISDDVYQT